MRSSLFLVAFLGLCSFIFAQQRNENVLSATKSSAKDASRLRELGNVLSKGGQPDRKIDKKAMSVRWTGKLRIPATGNYVFRQIPSVQGSSKMKLWINDQPILDTFGNNAAGSSKEDVGSVPVSLTAGKSADFRLEFSHKTFGAIDFPVAVLTWESEAMEKQIVPNAALIASKDSAGLNGEYFADESFKRKAFVRIDDSVEFIWDRGSVENGFSPEFRKTTKRILAQIANDSFLASLSAEEAVEFSKQIAPDWLAVMNAGERLAFIDAISRQSRLFKGLPIDRLLVQLASIGLLASDKYVELLLVWSKENPPPRTVSGSYISGVGTYYSKNVAPYRMIGQSFLDSDDSTDGSREAILDSLELTDGECNLTIIYSLIASCRENRLLPKIGRRIEEKLADEKCFGDVRVSWLLAKAYFKEVGLTEMIRPGRALPVLHEALATAESPEFRFWAVQEIVARLITVNRIDEAKSLVASMREQFPEPEKQSVLDEWLGEGDRLSAQYIESKNKIKKTSHREFAKEMGRRSDGAMKTGDTETARTFKAKAEASLKRDQ